MAVVPYYVRQATMCMTTQIEVQVQYDAMSTTSTAVQLYCSFQMKNMFLFFGWLLMAGESTNNEQQKPAIRYNILCVWCVCSDFS